VTVDPASGREHQRLRRFEGRWLRILGRALGRLFTEEAGFTLVETLVAFTVLTLVLIVLLAGLSQVTRGGRDAEAMREALRLAQSKLDGLGVTEPLTPGESTGRFGNGFEWHLRIREVRKGTNVYLMGASAEITVSAPADGVRVPHAVSLVTFKLAGASRQ
jgi:general secretion pathway protein I